MSMNMALAQTDDAEYEAVHMVGLRAVLPPAPRKAMIRKVHLAAMMYCMEDAARQHMRAYKVLYGDFDNDPTVPVGDYPTAVGVIFIDREHRFYVNVWTHDMLGPYDTWQAAAACAKLILDSEGDK